MSKNYKCKATCINKYIRGEQRRSWGLVGKREKNEFAEYHLVFESEEGQGDFLVTEFEYNCVEINDSGELEYQDILNSLKIVKFNEQIVR